MTDASLETLRSRAAALPSLRELLEDPARLAALHCEGAGITADFSRQRVRLEDRDALLAYADARGLAQGTEQLFAPNRLNPTEGRAVLHTALRRAPEEAPLVLDGTDISAAIAEALRRMGRIAEDLRSGRWRGATGAAITDVVHIGIGGSFLGPALAYEALGPSTGPRLHFLANVDGVAAQRTLAGLDPTRTLIIVVAFNLKLKMPYRDQPKLFDFQVISKEIIEKSIKYLEDTENSYNYFLFYTISISLATLYLSRFLYLKMNKK